MRAVETLEDRVLLTLAPGTLLDVLAVPPVLAVQGTPAGPVQVGSFLVSGQVGAGQPDAIPFAATVDFGTGQPLQGSLVTTSPGPVIPAPSGEIGAGLFNLADTDGNFAISFSQNLTPSTTVEVTNFPSNLVTLTQPPGNAQIPRASTFNPGGSFDIGTMPGFQLYNALPNPAGPFITLQTGDGSIGNAGIPGVNGLARGEIRMNFAPGTFVALDGDVGTPEMYIFENFTPEYFSVALIGSTGVETAFYFTQATVFASGNTTVEGDGVTEMNVTALDFDDPFTFASDPNFGLLGNIVGIRIRAIRAGSSTPGQENVAVDGIELVQPATLGVNVDANGDALRGRHVVHPTVGLLGPNERPVSVEANQSTTTFFQNSRYPGIPNRTRFADSTPDIAYVTAAPGALLTTTTQVDVFVNHTFPAGGTFIGTTTLETSFVNGFVGATTFRSLVAGLTLTPEPLPAHVTGIPFTGVLATTNPVPEGFPSPLPQFYRAFVNWGDGTPTTQVMVTDVDGDGILEIVADASTPHIYTSSGLYTISIDIYSVDNILIDRVYNEIEVEGPGIVDPMLLPFLNINDVTVLESAGIVTFTVSLDRVVNFDVWVDFSTDTAPGPLPSATSGTDFLATSGSMGLGYLLPPLFIPAGQLTATFSVPIINDSIREYDERFIARLSNPVNAHILDGEGIATIIDDDPDPIVRIEDAIVLEGGELVFSVYLVDDLGAPVVSERVIQINVYSQDLTAIGGLDYELVDVNLTFLPGENGKMVRVRTFHDSLVEPDETFTLNVATPVNARVDALSFGTGTILSPVVPQISVGDAIAVEADGYLVFTLTLDQPTTVPVTVAATTVNGTATGGLDFTPVAVNVTFAPGQTVATVMVPIFEDNLAEGPETLTLALSNPVNGLIADGIGVGTIVDASVKATITVLPDPAPVVEGGAVIFTVTLDRGTQVPANAIVTVDYRTFDLTATAGLDYVPRSGTLTFGPNETVKTISVPTIDDTLYEVTPQSPFEHFGLEIFNPSIDANLAGGDLNGGATAVATIIDNEQLPTVTVAPLNAFSVEGGMASFVISLSAPFTAPVSVNYGTADAGFGPGFATAGLDYLPTFGTVVFEPGETVKVVHVPILVDTQDEPTEIFNFQLISAVNGVIAPNSIVLGTILDITPPKVIDIQRIGYHEQTTRIVIAFSEAMDLASALNTDNYHLVAAGRDGRFGTADDIPFFISEAVYDPTFNTVTLTVGSRLALHRAYQLTINGVSPLGLRDVAGNYLNGGQNATLTFGRVNGLRDLRRGGPIGRPPVIPRPFGHPPQFRPVRPIQAAADNGSLSPSPNTPLAFRPRLNRPLR